MVTNRIICCSKCKRELFYIDDSYKMATKVICIDCGDKKTIRKKKSKTVRTAAGNFARTKKGIRKDIHPKYSFKSATEANFARILDFLGLKWKYEERAFTFDGYKNKPHVYIMDFEVLPSKKKIPSGIECGWVEIKGYMDARSRSKLRRYKANYPEEAAKTIIVIYTKYRKKDIEFCKKLGYRYIFYDALTKEYESQISTWE